MTTSSQGVVRQLKEGFAGNMPDLHTELIKDWSENELSILVYKNEWKIYINIDIYGYITQTLVGLVDRKWLFHL